MSVTRMKAVPLNMPVKSLQTMWWNWRTRAPVLCVRVTFGTAMVDAAIACASFIGSVAGLFAARSVKLNLQ